MNPAAAHTTFGDLWHLIRAHRARWLVPAVVVGALGVVLAIVHQPKWEARQALVLRNEAANNADGPGKFNVADEMKTVQETILELSRSSTVLRGALVHLGPDAQADTEGEWPTDRDVERLRKSIKLTPPNGAEYGKTEVFYLNVRHTDRERAKALATAVCDQLEAAFQRLRDDKARSMIAELVKAVDLSRADLEASTRQLAETEGRVGGDLAELRILHDSSSGDSALRRTVTEIRNELRQVRSTIGSQEHLLSLLQEVEQDPGRLEVVPNQLIESQPALRRLKEGLAEAQLRRAGLAGGMSESHPLVVAARESEEEIARSIRRQLATALRGVEIDVRLSRDRAAMLEEQLAKTTNRLERLAGLRATYTNQVAQTRHRTSLVERAEQRLAEARATEATAKAAHLIARVDAPETGVDPLGPGRAVIALAGLVGGLVGGLGLVFLTVPATPVAQPAQPAFPLRTGQALKTLSSNRRNGHGVHAR